MRNFSEADGLRRLDHMIDHVTYVLRPLTGRAPRGFADRRAEESIPGTRL